MNTYTSLVGFLFAVPFGQGGHRCYDDPTKSIWMLSFSVHCNGLNGIRVNPFLMT